MIKRIIQDHEKLIRTKSEEIKKIDYSIQELIADLEDTLEIAEGVGISAIQIGIPKRIIIVKGSSNTYRMINPIITKKMGSYIDYEGCLSVSEKEYPYIYGTVARSLIVKVEYLDEYGKKQELMADGLLARIIQHELDHLDGILYIDEALEIIKFKTEKEREKWRKEKQDKIKPRVLIGMSGGVDSSVSAILLKEMGYEVVGATMIMWDQKETELAATQDAKKVCEQLGIEHHIFHCEDMFKKKVMDYFTDCYYCGQTPNPCVECNKYLKFGTFYQKAIELKCQYISTGHYAKVEWDELYQSMVMKKSKASAKDQTYFLYGISKEILSKLVFPLAEISEKEEVREIAKQHQLEIAEKPDSQEVCFIPDNDYGKFLRENRKDSAKIGNIVLEDGTILGKHKGLIYYTIGQRKGLGIAYPDPLYVLKIDTNKNEIIVGTEKQLYTTKLCANETNFLVEIDLSKPIAVMAKVRYRAKETKAMIYQEENGKIKVVFEEPQRAVTKGQSVVFYIGDILIGGGKII